MKIPLTAPASCTIGKWSEDMYRDHIQGPADSYYIRYIVGAMNPDRRSQASPLSDAGGTGLRSMSISLWWIEEDASP